MYDEFVVSPVIVAITTALSASLLLVVVHLYLRSVAPSRALDLWTLAWALYTLRLLFALMLEVSGGSPLLLWCNQVASVCSAVFLLWGARVHAKWPVAVPRVWLVTALFLIVLITVAVLVRLPWDVTVGPVFIFLALGNGAIALAYVRSRSISRSGRVFVAVVFLVWGLHKLDYPLLRRVPEAAVWGYVLGALLAMAAGVALLTTYLDEARHLAQEVRRKFASLVYSMNDLVFTLDRDGRYTGVHGGWVKGTRVPAEEAIGRTPVYVFGETVGKTHLAMLRECFESGRPVTYEWKTSGSDGIDHHFQTTMSPIDAGNRPPDEVVGIARSITDIKEAQRTLESSLRERTTLLQEVHHRVKNNLQLVVSLLRLRSDQTEDADTRRALHDMIGRVLSMALVHEKLYQSENYASIPFGTYLSSLVPRVVDLASENDTPGQVVVETEAMHVHVSEAVPLGLVAVELVSNAVMHAFPEVEQPTLRVEFQKQQAEHLLIVADNGPGIPEEVMRSGGDSLGLHLVRSLTAQMGGTLAVDTVDGTVLTVRVPAEPAVTPVGGHLGQGH